MGLPQSSTLHVCLMVSRLSETVCCADGTRADHGDGMWPSTAPKSSSPISYPCPLSPDSLPNQEGFARARITPRTSAPFCLCKGLTCLRSEGQYPSLVHHALVRVSSANKSEWHETYGHNRALPHPFFTSLCQVSSCLFSFLSSSFCPGAA